MGRGAGAMGTPRESPFSTPSSQAGLGPNKGDRDDSLMGKTVRIQAGQWKGYLGSVSHTTATHVQVELHSRLKKVMVVKERVHVIGDKFGATGENGDVGNGFAMAPMSFMGGATPMHGGATPIHGGATPMYGGATPMHGGATPSRDSYGGSTPSHRGISDDVWKPGGSIDRNHEAGDDNMTDVGSGWSVAYDNTPQVQNNSFVDSNATTGASGWGDAQLPIKHDDDPYAAMHTENSGMESTIEGSGEDAAVWFMERVCVQLKKNSAQAVIKEINGSQAVVELEDKSTQTVRNGEVTMVPPQEHDMVLVTGGADVGVEGELVCIDGTDAILKESNENFKIVDFVHLAKIAA